MTRNLKWAESLIFALIAVTLLATVALSFPVDLRHSIFSSAFLKERTNMIRIALSVYGFLLAFLAVASANRMRRHGSTLSANVLRAILVEFGHITQWLSKAVGPREVAFWLPAVTAVGLTIRGYFLAQPMRYDEAYTFLKFVNTSFIHLFDYPLPNNHVFYTLLVRASVTVFGNHPVAIRLPALLAGVFVIPTSFLFARLLSKGRGGFLASALAAVFPFLVLYDTMTRGYSWVVLLSLWLAILGLRFSSNPSTTICFLMSLITALGIFTMPSFLFPTAGLILWVGLLMLIRKTKLKFVCRFLVLPFGTMTMILTGLFYTPVIIVNNGIHTIIRNRFVAGMSWGSFLDHFPSHGFETLANFSRDVPLVVLFTMLILILAGLYAAAKKQDWEVFILVPALVIGAFVTLFMKHNIPFPRTWIFFLPFVFILMDAGCLEFRGLIPSGLGPFLRGALLILVSFWAVVLMNHNVIASYPDTGQFPEAQVVAEFLSKEMNEGDELKVNCPADAPLYFYQWYKGIPSGKSSLDTSRRKQFLIVKPSIYSLSDLTHGDARKILSLADAEVYVSYLSGK